METNMNFRKKMVQVLCMALLWAIHAQAQQQQAQGNPTIGNWILDYAATTNAVTGSARTTLNGMDTDIKQKLDEFYKGRRFIFHRNGTFQIIVANGTVHKGTWSFANGILSLGGGNNNVDYAVALTDTHLLLGLQGHGAEGALIKTLYLTSFR